MNICSQIFKLSGITLLILISFSVIAQEKKEGAANINKIATVTDGKPGKYLKTTESAQLKRNNKNDWSEVNRHDELYFNDMLKLDKNIWLRLNIKNKTQKGNISLLQNPKDLNESGKYPIIEDKDGSGKVAIELIQGYGIVNVMNNKISTITGGIQSAVTSNSTSRALFLVRPDSSGEIFLQQGHLTFPENSEVKALEVGQLAQFKDGKITNVFFPEAIALTEYNDFIKFNNQKVWKKPFLKQPVTWIGLAAVAVGTTLIITKPWDKKASGTININWGSN